MDAFEHVIATILERDGFWVRTTFKVELTKEDKVAIGRPSSPRWELDVIGYRPAVTVDSLLVNEPVGIDEFSLVMSEGTRVSDGRRHTIYYAASTPPLAPSSLRFVVVLIPVLIGMAVVLTLIIRHRAIALKSC